MNMTGAKLLPLEVINWEILPKLPVESLLRFRCVCKQWQSLLSTQDFVTSHLQNSRAHPKLLLLESPSDAFRTLDCEQPSDHLSTTIRCIPFEHEFNDVLFLGSLNGLVCVAIRNPRTLMFWNPMTGACKKLANYKYHGFCKLPDAVGFYIDSSNDYKLLHVNRKRCGTSIRAYIYSLKQDKWRRIDFLENAQRIINYEWSPVTFSDKSLYFIARARHVFIGGEILVIGFDVNSQKFREIHIPPVPIRCRASLVDVNDCIHLSIIDRDGNADATDVITDLWRMKGEGWMNVASSVDQWGVWNPIYVMRNGNWLVIRECMTAVYEKNLKTMRSYLLYTISWYDDIHLRKLGKLKHVKYIETLVSPYNS